MSAVMNLHPYAPQPDLGTPAPRDARASVRLSIDGRAVEVPAGTVNTVAPDP